MAPRTPTLAVLLDEAVRSGIARMRVMLPGRIESYDAVTQRGNVKPLLMESFTDIDGVEQQVSLAVIPGVKIILPGAAGFRITFPVAAGDFVTLHFSDRSLDRWINGSGAEVDPVDLRRHDLSDPVAYLGLTTFAGAWNTNPQDCMTVGKDGEALHWMALADRLRTELDALWTAVLTHTHLYSPGPGGPTPTGTYQANGGSSSKETIASATVKVTE